MKIPSNCSGEKFAFSVKFLTVFLKKIRFPMSLSGFCKSPIKIPKAPINVPNIAIPFKKG